MYRELLIGCGYKHEKRLRAPGTQSTWQGLITLDNNELCKPDYICDLDDPDPTRGKWRVFSNRYIEGFSKDDSDDSFHENSFDEVHAYEVLEHLGAQGHVVPFFETFSEIWRVLKPGGYLCATTPSRYSGWLWGDPGHRRAIIQESLTFLVQTEYEKQKGVTSLSDYRSVYRADFDIVFSQDDRTTHAFILRAVKPSRVAV